MSQINFLPDSFRKQYARKRRRPIELIIIAGTILGLLGTWFSLTGPDQALANELERVESEIASVNQLYDERDALQSQRSELQRRLLIARETYQPITTTQAIARLSELAPEAVRIVSLEIVNERPEPEMPPADEPSGNTQVVGNPAANNPIETREPSQMRIAIAGHAPSDEEIVTLIRRLRNDPVFTIVSLRGSRVDQTDTHYVRAFRLDVTIDMDRRFVPTAGHEQGVGDEN